MSELATLSMAYDWVGETVYISAMRDQELTFWKVPIINPEGFEMIFEIRNVTHIEKAVIAMNPFSG